VVNNVDDTVKYFEEEFGFGPFEIRQVSYPTATYYGETAGYRGKRGFFNLGSIQIELIELVDGKTIHEDFLKEHGEGIHHIGFAVEDLEQSKQNAAKAGFSITQGYSRPDGTGFAYLNTEKTGGVIFELIQRNKKQ
jgi:methylmalonyl-CoA/ethylmalonyl-CoA epimerase